MAEGLLGFLGTPGGQGLLSAVAGGLAGARRGTPLNNIGRGLLAGTAGYAQGLDREQQAQQLDMLNQYRDMQMKGLQSEIARNERDAAEKDRINKLVADTFLPVTGTTANQATGITGPRPEAAQAIGTVPQVNYQHLLAQGVPADRVKALAEAQNYGRTKVARTVKGMGPDGREYEYQVDDFGQRVGDGLAQYRAPIQADTGGAVQFLDPYTQRPVSSLAKTLSPDAQASNALGWANNAVSRERLAFDKDNAKNNAFTFNAELGGYVPKAPGGQFVPLAGGPGGAGGKLTEGESKATLYLGQMRSATNELNKLVSAGKEPWASTVQAANSPWSNWMTPASAQQTAQLQNQWSEAFLRAKTGAAATPGEVQLNNRTFFPQIGDGPDVIEQKARMRLQAERDMEAPAGRGATRVPKVEPVKRKNDDLKGLPPDIANLLNQY